MRDKNGSSEAAWQEEELSAAALPDKRLGRRLRRLLDQMSAAPGKPIPAACGDWAAAKAAYRFFDNPPVTEHSVLAGHFAATAARIAASEVRSLSCRTRPNLSTAARSRVKSVHQDHQRRALQGRAAQRADFVRGADAFEPGRHPHRHAPRSDGGEVLDTNEIQGNARAQAAHQSHARADRDEGELPLAGEPAPVHRARWRSRALRACW
ncbi:transposase [Mesorhizobium sp. M1365]